MAQYPPPGQDPNQQQYPGQGQEYTQYSGAGYSQSSPNQPAYQQQNYQQPNYQQPGYQQDYQQSGYQQPGYQQPGYQQPGYQQSPYAQSPYPQAPAIAFDYRNIIAGVGAIVAIIAFFLPFYSATYANYTSTVSGSQLGGRLWLDFIIALVALLIVVLLQFGDQLLKNQTTPFLQKAYNSLKTQPRTWYLALLTTGVFGIFFHFILDLGTLGNWGIGSWLFLFGLIAIVVGAVLFIRPPASTPINPTTPPTY